ncbi:MAG: hypothetical protein EA353_11050 [Puniceicoccaceae bacterium]|nr:MAG: hypothetical protein EA353_11050 [Puniceicoccaceae bacterium]
MTVPWSRLLYFARDFLTFCNNFVSFPHFYDPERRAIFQSGELLIDGRRIRLCVWVENLDQHATIAQRSGIYTVYCEVRSAKHATPRLIAAAVTAGTAGRIEIGKNGIFYDRAGVDWEARVVRILAQPISLHEAVFAPFRKLGRMLSTQIEKLADSREQDMQRSVNTSFTELDRSAGSAAAEAPLRARPANPAEGASPAGNRSFGVGGLLAGGGFAIAAIGSSFAIVAERLKLVGTSGILYTVVVILLFLLIPSLIVAVIKLRGRDLGDVLEASGWAISGAIRLNFGLSRRLTRRGVYPASAILPAPPGRRRRILYGITAVLLAAYAIGRGLLGLF